MGDEVGDVFGSQPDGGQAGAVLPHQQDHPFGAGMVGNPQGATGPVPAGEGRAVPRQRRHRHDFTMPPRRLRRKIQALVTTT